MKSKILLTKPIFEGLIEHLVYMEENINELAGFYYPEDLAEQEKIKNFFIEYINKIESELEGIEVIKSIEKYRNKDSLNDFPFVIIGSRVNVSDLNDKSNTSFKLVHPVNNSNIKSEISYLSALGKALLLKDVNSEVTVNLPSKVLSYKITSIRLV